MHERASSDHAHRPHVNGHPDDHNTTTHMAYTIAQHTQQLKLKQENAKNGMYKIIKLTTND